MITANKPYRDMWITPQPSFARLPGIEPRSSSSSPSLPRPGGSRPPSTDLVKSKTSRNKSRKKGKSKSSPDSSVESSSQPQQRQPSAAPPTTDPKSPSSPLPHEEDAGPSGFGTANEDYNTLTEEYLAAAKSTGYDGRVKDVENEGPLVEGSKAWEEAQEEDLAVEEAVTPPTNTFAPVDGADEFRNVWER